MRRRSSRRVGSMSHRQVSVGVSVEIMPEPENEFDHDAVMVCVAGEKVGNVNRLQAPTFLRWLNTCNVEASLERLNGSPDRPRAYVFIRVSPSEIKRAA